MLLHGLWTIHRSGCTSFSKHLNECGQDCHWKTKEWQTPEIEKLPNWSSRFPQHHERVTDGKIVAKWSQYASFLFLFLGFSLLHVIWWVAQYFFSWSWASFSYQSLLSASKWYALRIKIMYFKTKLKWKVIRLRYHLDQTTYCNKWIDKCFARNPKCRHGIEWT